MTTIDNKYIPLTEQEITKKRIELEEMVDDINSESPVGEVLDAIACFVSPAYGEVVTDDESIGYITDILTRYSGGLEDF